MLLLGSFLLATALVAQPAAADPTFMTGSGADGDVRTFAVQADGKILVGGYFTAYNGVEQVRLVRLNVDGSLDPSFDTGTGPVDGVTKILVQPDGKILVVGQFNVFNGIFTRNLIRLNEDGTLDPDFDTGAGPVANIILSMVLQEDGKIIIGGTFSTYDGVSRKNIARANSDGSLDLSFDPGDGFVGSAEALAVQPDGKILVGGGFAEYNGVPRRRILRLNADASLDLSFSPGTGANGTTIKTIALQPDGKILIGGPFTEYNDESAMRIARLNADGSLDGEFSATAWADGWVGNVIVQPNGKILLSGDFDNVSGITTTGVARLNADGSADDSFGAGSGTDHWVSGMALQSDGKIYIGGQFQLYNDETHIHLARLNGGPLGPTAVVEVNRKETLRLWPNPIQNGPLNLDLGNEAQNRAVVTIHDAMGKLVLQRTLRNGIDRIASLALPEDLTNGLYSVGVAANGTTYHSSLSILR